MTGVNKVILVGNLGRDPEVRYTKSGQAVATFTLATTEKWTGRDGNKEKKTEWHRVVAWGKLGEICGEYLKKGQQVYIDGRIQTREWEDANENKNFTTEIVANNMVMLSHAGQQGNSDQRGSSSPESYYDNSSGPDDFEDEDIPF